MDKSTGSLDNRMVSYSLCVVKDPWNIIEMEDSYLWLLYYIFLMYFNLNIVKYYCKRLLNLISEFLFKSSLIKYQI